MPTITRMFEFDYGHRVLGHEGKCRHLHGHRGKAEVTISSGGLDAIGRVIDFGVVKEWIGGWIDDNWDHNMILHSDDPLRKIEDWDDVFAGRRPFIMPDHCPNPTAENLAEILYGHIQRIFEIKKAGHLTVTKVCFHETPACSATYPSE